MKIRYDKLEDAAYISFLDEGEELHFDFTYTCDNLVVGGEINLDFDVSGRLIGLEVQQASKKLPLALLRLEK
jgi:uncharacterized protein YuzE